MNMRFKVERRWWRAIGLMAALTVSTAEAGWTVGTALPDLAACKLEGALPATAGKVVLLDFWGSWCGPCKASFPALDALQKQYAKQGLIVLAVNLDEKPEAMHKFLKEHPVSFAVVRDAAQKLVKQADVQSMPSSFVIDRAGKVRFAHTGFYGDKTVAEYRTQIESLLPSKGALK
jgi:thiol-disulfide isomerase/thioredoxin